MENVLKGLIAKFPGCILSKDSDCFRIQSLQTLVFPLFQALKEELKFNLLLDLTVVDWSGVPGKERFEVVYHVLSLSKRKYLRIASFCVDNERPVAQSITEIYPAANWHEREAYDMFGVAFKGHPDLRRILMWEGYPYYPLRKEFPLAGFEAKFPAADVVAATGVKVEAAPMMGGPFRSHHGISSKYREPAASDESWTESKPKPTIIGE